MSSNFNQIKNKSKILFTGSHHARELLCPNMIIRIFIDSLFELIHSKNQMRFWKQNDIIIVPIINLDSHNFISESFGNSDFE